MSSKGKQDNFNEVITLNKINSIPDQKKTYMAMMLENALREKIQKEKQSK